MFRKQTPPVGAQPGALGSVERFPKPKIHVIDYNDDKIHESDISSTNELLEYRSNSNISWIDVQGLGDTDVLKQVADIFGLHPLALGDIVNVPSRPKMEDYGDYLLLISCQADIKKEATINIEQIAIVLGAGFVITFQENYGDVLDPVRTRLRQHTGAIRKSGADYLVYALLDTLVDGYYPILETVGEQLEDIEESVITAYDRSALHDLYRVRRELLKFRRAIWPQREVLHALSFDGAKYFNKKLSLFFRDIYDHCFQVLEVIETYRETCGDLTDVYLSSMSNRLNDVMKILTIFSTIFIPLTFITSVYGMNFPNIPEFSFPYAYQALWGFLLAVAGGLLFFFFKKGWLTSDS